MGAARPGDTAVTTGHLVSMCQQCGCAAAQVIVPLAKPEDYELEARQLEARSHHMITVPRRTMTQGQPEPDSERLRAQADSLGTGRLPKAQCSRPGPFPGRVRVGPSNYT